MYCHTKFQTHNETRMDDKHALNWQFDRIRCIFYTLAGKLLSSRIHIFRSALTVIK